MTTEQRQAIETFIATDLAKQLKLHAASCRLVSYHDEVATIKILGGCSGCPSSQLAIFKMVVPALKEKFPQIKNVLLD